MNLRPPPPEGETFQVRSYPAEMTPFEAFSELFGVSAVQLQRIGMLAALIDHPKIAALLELEGEQRPDEQHARALIGEVR